MAGITKEEQKRRAELLARGIKICGHCKRELPVEQFSKTKRNKDGLNNKCKECASKHEKQYRQQHKEKIQQYKQQRYTNIKNGTHIVNPGKTHEQFIKELHEVNSNIEVLEHYKGIQVKIKVKCKIDGYEWEATPGNLLKEHGCPKCAKLSVKQQLTKTHEQFIKELQQINQDIEVLGIYINDSSKIKLRCKVCDYEWEATPNRLLQGTGCPKCAGKMKKTHEQFINDLVQINKDIQVLGTYKNANTKIKCKCKICGHEWKTLPSSLLKGRGCPVCAKVKRVQKRTKTHNQFIKELKEVNHDIEVLDTYETANTKIKVKCKIDGHIWEAKPASLLNGIGCPKCGRVRTAQKRTKTHEQFIEELKQINPNIEVLDTYKKGHTKILCKCKIDGYEWKTAPTTLLNGCGCPVCAKIIVKQKETKTHEQFIEELAQVNQDIEILGTYKNAVTKIKVKCKKDGHIWEAKPVSLLRGHGCPKCGISKGEKIVAQYLDSLNIEYIFNRCYFNDLIGIKGGVMKPDFIIPSLKIWIEYDGIQHYKPVDFSNKMSEEQLQEQFKITQQNDQIKNQYAQQHNWTLIRIPYWDYDNIEKILDSYLKQEEELAL